MTEWIPMIALGIMVGSWFGIRIGFSLLKLWAQKVLMEKENKELKAQISTLKQMKHSQTVVKVQVPATPLSSDQLLFIIRACHPDKFSDEKEKVEANKVTGWLILERKTAKAKEG